MDVCEFSPFHFASKGISTGCTIDTFWASPGGHYGGLRIDLGTEKHKILEPFANNKRKTNNKLNKNIAGLLTAEKYCFWWTMGTQLSL